MVTVSSDIEKLDSKDALKVKVLKLPHYPAEELPKYATPGSVGVDLIAAIEETIYLSPGDRMLVPNGIKLEMPPGIEAQIRSRSGIAYKDGVVVLNAPGTIDSDYRGEICTLLINHGIISFAIEPGMRISQMVFNRVLIPELVRTSEPLTPTERSEGGFGSTGTK